VRQKTGQNPEFEAGGDKDQTQRELPTNDNRRTERTDGGLRQQQKKWKPPKKSSRFKCMGSNHARDYFGGLSGGVTKENLTGSNWGVFRKG